MSEQLVDLNDSDILRIEGALLELRKRQGQSIPMESFRQEAIERFQKIGFEVDVRTYTTDQLGLFTFDIDIVSRLEGEFDPDQMVYEATHDVLDIGEKGVIKTGEMKPDH